jgi:UDP-glucose 4-epimerase
MTIKVLVTGGAGFIGSHIVDRLIEAGHEVAVLDHDIAGKSYHINLAASQFELDLLDGGIAECFNLFRPEVVLHHGGHVNVKNSMLNPMMDASSNIMGTIHLLEQCKYYGVRKIVYASSAAVYGNPSYLGIDEQHPIQPISNYGISKYVPEMYIRAYADNYDLEYTILRYSNVYGHRQSVKGEGNVISTFVSKLLNGEQLSVHGDGRQTRDFVYIDDVVNANLAALTLGNREIINISSGQPISILEVIELLGGLLQTKVDYRFEAARPGDIRHSYLLNLRAAETLGWQPKISLEDGLTRMIQHYRSGHTVRSLR